MSLLVFAIGAVMTLFSVSPFNSSLVSASFGCGVLYGRCGLPFQRVQRHAGGQYGNPSDDQPKPVRKRPHTAYLLLGFGLSLVSGALIGRRSTSAIGFCGGLISLALVVYAFLGK